jgi:epimerase transport system membrane fusion protein
MSASDKVTPLKPELAALQPRPALAPKIERQERWLRQGGILAIVLLFGGLGAWSFTAPLDSAAMGPGVIVLENYRKAVQHLEGGIVQEVRAREGQMVRKGDVLLKLEDVQSRAQMEQVRGQLLITLAREARLIAQRDGMSRVVYPAPLLAMAKDSRAADVMRGQDQIFRARKQSQEGEITLYGKQIAQLREKKEGLQEQKVMRDKLVSSYEKERADFEALVREGYTERQRVREMERNLAQNEGQRGALMADMASTDMEISAAQVKILQLDKELQREVGKELAEVQAELFSLREKMRSLDDTLARTIITAPDDGKVLALSVHTPGEVLRPGAHILDIVPANESLIVEARLSPQDVDQVHVGQMAEVRFSAFRQRDMPKIQGQLATLSADRLLDEGAEQKQPYYLARVIITPEGMQDLARLKLELLPGMPAEVMVNTGRRTFWHYLTAPLSDMLVRSFKED